MKLDVQLVCGTLGLGILVASCSGAETAGDLFGTGPSAGGTAGTTAATNGATGGANGGSTTASAGTTGASAGTTTTASGTTTAGTSSSSGGTTTGPGGGTSSAGNTTTGGGTSSATSSSSTTGARRDGGPDVAATGTTGSGATTGTTRGTTGGATAGGVTGIGPRPDAGGPGCNADFAINGADKACTNTDSCTFFQHQTDCCGSTLGVGVNHSFIDQYNAAETKWRAEVCAAVCDCASRTSSEAGDMGTPDRLIVRCEKQGASGTGECRTSFK